MMNILNGGRHADNPIDIQEFMIQPIAAPIHRGGGAHGGGDLRRAEANSLSAAGHNTNVGDEGGFAPGLSSADAALGFISRACEAAGYIPGEDVTFALDCAATEFFHGRAATGWTARDAMFDAGEMVEYLADLVARYPIASIEDGCSEDDWQGWALLTDRLGARRVQLVGDDLFVTNPRRLRDGIEQGVANAILVKVNQIGTLSETLEAMEIAHRAGYTPP